MDTIAKIENKLAHIKQPILAPWQGCDFFLASGSESAFYVYVRLRQTHMHLTQYRSPGKDRHLDENKWI